MIARKTISKLSTKLLLSREHWVITPTTSKLYWYQIKACWSYPQTGFKPFITSMYVHYIPTYHTWSMYGVGMIFMHGESQHCAIYLRQSSSHWSASSLSHFHFPRFLCISLPLPELSYHRSILITSFRRFKLEGYKVQVNGQLKLLPTYILLIRI